MDIYSLNKELNQVKEELSKLKSEVTTLKESVAQLIREEKEDITFEEPTENNYSIL